MADEPSADTGRDNGASIPFAEPSDAAAGPDAGSTTHDIPLPAGLREEIAKDWAPAPRMPHPASPSGEPSVGAATYAKNRAALSSAFPGAAIAIPSGLLAARANDTDYPFRAHSPFTWLTGETVEGAVLLLAPTPAGGHRATLYLREYAGPGEVAYFTDRSFGALWVGNVPTVTETADVLGLQTRQLSELASDLRAVRSRILSYPGVDPDLDGIVTAAASADGNAGLRTAVDELRLVKDDWEISQLQAACDATARGFADVAGEIPAVLAAGGQRGERWLEGTFWRRARLEGNEVGYTSIVGAGRHATTLHWWRNNGDVAAGQLLLADMGVELDSLFTADVTRTLPVSGEWTATQRQLYAAVLEAQEAGIAEVRAGADFLAAHRASMWVLADHLHHWGVLPVTAEVSCSEDAEAPGAGLHRRYTLHGVSHMLGIDVHDCAAAREETYRKGTLKPGYALTVEPGLYFQQNDLSVPAEWRGIGIRIEDDIVVTESAPLNLSASLPRDPDEITAWLADCQSRPVRP